MFFRLSAYVNPAPPFDGLRVKLDIRSVYEKSVAKIKIWLKSEGKKKKTFGTLHEDQRVFHIIISSIYRAKINGTHCCFSMATFTLYIILPTAKIYVNSTKVRVVTLTL